MDLSQTHFSHPLWLWALLVIPLIGGIFFLYYQKHQPAHQLEKFIDKHLIPYLLLEGEHKKKKEWTQLLSWSFVWCCLVLALAGPRWSFREVDTFTRDQSLAILLDLSESMNAKDVPPSRLGLAKQKIEDLLNMSRGVKIGLIAFAADPHMIVPITEDKETIRHLLPSLDTDLVYVQGSKLSPALEMAATMLENEPGNNKAIAVISDGGFEDASSIRTAKKLAEKGILLYTIGVGSQEGAPLTDRQGALIKKNGSPLISKLEKEKFREISKIGQGRYFDADHSGQVALIFEDLEKRSHVQQEAHKTQRFWEEHFYLFLLPILPFFLWWYRRGYIFALLLFCLLPNYSEASLSDYFYNGEQQANQAYEKEDYITASESFQDPYRKGVAYYRAGNYTAAEEMFRQSTRPEVASSAAYNLGNALVQQNKLQEAVVAYEEVLKKWPHHKPAKDNLELVKKMIEQQQQEQKEQPQPQQDDQNRQKDADQQKNKQEQQEDQKEKDSQTQDQKESSENQSQKKPDSAGKGTNKDKKKEQSDEKNPSQQPSEENTSSEDEKNSSDKQNAEEQSQEQSSKESSAKGKGAENADKQEESDAKASSQKQSEEKDLPTDIEKAQQPKEQTMSTQPGKEKPVARSQEDLDADLWLNQIKNDPKSFLKNKFYLESKKNGTKEEVDPW